MTKNRPPMDLVLVAPKTSLVVRRNLHPAIQYLLLQAAEEIHSAPGIFQKAGQFPAPESVDLPLSKDARQYYRAGVPFLQHYLPFWMAVVAGQLLVLLIPIIGVVYPLLRFVPTLYGWGMRRRVFRLYGELKFLESDMELRAVGSGVDDLVTRLDRIEDRADHMRMPMAFAHMLYTLRDHISSVRARLRRRQEVVRDDASAEDAHR